MKKIISTVAVIAIAGAMLMPASSASAQQAGAAAGTCTVDLPEWPAPPNSSSPDCVGIAVGAVLPNGPTCAVPCEFRASVPSYTETCFLDEPPLIGQASGTLSLDGTAVADYEWLRVGLVAVVTLNETGSGSTPTGAGVAAFAPHAHEDTLGTCENHLPLTATVAGAVFAAQT
jgi:hypothetical protein